MFIFIHTGYKTNKNFVVKERNYVMVDFEGANLKEANLKRATLEVANLRAATLREVNLEEADLSYTQRDHLVKVNLEGVFNGLILKGANNLI